MKKRVCFALFVVFLFSTGGLKAQESEIKDTPWFSGMPSFTIYDGEDIDFDSYKFFNGKNCITVEGKIFKRQYSLKEDVQKVSKLQISRNYGNAIRAMGGSVIYEGEPQDAECTDNNGRLMVVGKVVKGVNELWVEILPGEDDYYITVALKGEMKQEVTSQSLFEALNRDGHVALYINFDTGKSVIRDESGPIIEQVVQMLKSNPELKISVEGHTDNVGNASSNKTLSMERAKSVVAAIVGQGISADRLTSAGYGPDKPVADNATEEGRAKNRRVEIVKR